MTNVTIAVLSIIIRNVKKYSVQEGMKDIMIKNNMITEKDAEKVLEDEKNKKEATEMLENESDVDDLIKEVIKSLDNIPIIGKYFADVPTLCLLVKDYVSGAYEAIPVASVVTIVIALMYFVSPIDLIPDIIPILGKIDDAIVIAVAVGAVHNDIADYKKWKNLPYEKTLGIGDIL